MIEWVKFCLRQSFFYVFRSKTVRSPSQNRTVSEPKTYGFGTETIKGCYLNLQYKSGRLDSKHKIGKSIFVHEIDNSIGEQSE